MWHLWLICVACSALTDCSGLTSCLLFSFESWFDIDTLGEAENVVAAEREQNILSMLHQVSPPNHHLTMNSWLLNLLYNVWRVFNMVALCRERDLSAAERKKNEQNQRQSQTSLNGLKVKGLKLASRMRLSSFKSSVIHSIYKVQSSRRQSN